MDVRGWKNFVSELLDKIKAGEEVRVAYDQVSTPTSTDALARGILELMESEEYGVYHASCEGFCSRYDFCQKGSGAYRERCQSSEAGAGGRAYWRKTAAEIFDT